MPFQECEKRTFYFKKSLSLCAFTRDNDDVVFRSEFFFVKPERFPYESGKSVPNNRISDFLTANDPESSAARGFIDHQILVRKGIMDQVYLPKIRFFFQRFNVSHLFPDPMPFRSKIIETIKPPASGFIEPSILFCPWLFSRQALFFRRESPFWHENHEPSNENPSWAGTSFSCLSPPSIIKLFFGLFFLIRNKNLK